MNVENIKKDFPIFKHKEKIGERFIYLDNAATSQRPKQVIDAVIKFYETSNSNVHRGLCKLSEDATSNYECVRSKIAKYINARYFEEIIFTKGTTEGINFIAQAWARQHLKPGDEVVTTQIEHHTNLLPWQRVCKQTGAKLKFITLNTKDFKLEIPQNLVNNKTKLVAVTHSSNVLGPIWNEQSPQLQNLMEQAQAVGAKVLLDIAQSVMHQKVNLTLLNPDFAVFSGHKMLGPMGGGVLFIKKELHDEVEPYHLGGSMVNSVTFDDATVTEPPHKFEAGTPPVSSILGLGAAIDYITKNINFDKLAKHETMLCSKLIDGLQKIDGIYIAGNPDKIKKHSHVVAFNIEGIHPHDIAGFLGERGIPVRAGHHCAQPLINLLKQDALLRVSFAMYNTVNDVEIFLTELNNAIELFKNQSNNNERKNLSRTFDGSF